MSMPHLSLNVTSAETAVSDFPELFARCAALGGRRIALDSAQQLLKLGSDPVWKKALLTESAKCGITLFDAHAPHGLGDSLGNPLPGGSEYCQNSMLNAIHIAGDAGIKVLTMHLARTRLTGSFAPESGEIPDVALDKALERSLKILEVLLPEAEKAGITLALENLFLPSGTAAHLKDIIQMAAHPNLGLCYDSGHALLVERQTGKTPEMIADWIALGWENNTMTFQDEQLPLMLSQVVTAHLHDNHGCEDEHILPGTGIADWKKLSAGFAFSAPRLLSLQSEVSQKYLMPDLELSAGHFAKAGFPF